MRRITAGIGVLAIVAITACGDDDNGTGVTVETFGASLSGDEEVPPVDTDAEGAALFEWDGTSMLYLIEVAEITDLTLAHIHDGELGANGGVLVTLYPGPTLEGEISGVFVNDQFTAPDDPDEITIDELLERMRAGDVYVNVHTEENSGGEIRGQIAPIEEF